MNIKNNKRRQESVKKIESAFIECLQSRDLNKISVSDICKMTGLNRSTFYANFLDIYDLADKLMEKLERDFSELFSDYDGYTEENGALKMFTHIKDNQLFYKTYFKLYYEGRQKILTYDKKRATLELDNKHINYHIEFFRNGLNAIIKLWLDGGCLETPEEMAEILSREYSGRQQAYKENLNGNN